jgi:Domain of unknown function (DUF4962)/Heparinase II/III-like protein
VTSPRTSNGARLRRGWRLILLVLLASSLHAQDSREKLGPKDSAKSERNTGPHPLTGLMENVNARLRPELIGKHPRVYVTEAELAALRQRARSTHQALWQPVLQKLRALAGDPPPAPAQARRAQNDVGIAIAEAAFAYKIEGDKKYLDAARKYMDAAVSYDVWGYAYNKPNVDLAAGHLLYGLGWGYDLLYHDLTPQERARYREKLVKQARLLVDYYQPKPGRTFSYSQNHVFIPIAGLGVTAYALYDETPEASNWAKLARAIYDRVLATYSQDGYYYEGFEYWIFSTPWLIHYLDVLAHATGEDLYDRPGFRQTHNYVAHSMLPTGRYVFDFGDIFEGPLTRAGQGEEYKRTHPGGRFHTNYNLLYRLAQRFQSGEAQGVASWLSDMGQLNAEDFWSLVWYEPSVKSVPIAAQPNWHYFPDHDVFYWRSDWTKDATAFAFKCGPPEGHHTAALLQQLPDWHLSAGHAHPDANSFIIFARGQYLTGDTGYAGIPLTEHHNTLLIDGKGQAKEGKGHDVFDQVPYERLDKIRLVKVQVNQDGFAVSGDASTAYEPELGVKQFVRQIEYGVTKGFTITDRIETDRPAVLASLVHADKRIEKEAADRFSINGTGVRLEIDIVAPGQARTIIDENIVTAAGPPGAVDKGERQVRGQKLTISPTGPLRSARFVMRLKISDVQASKQ